MDRYGFAVLAADSPDGDRTALRIPFPRRVDTPDEVRAAMIDLVRDARTRTG